MTFSERRIRPGGNRTTAFLQHGAFSERNMVERQLPFVTGIYLFNNGNECIYEHYYATTLAAGREQKRKYENMQQEFKSTSDQYACLSDKDELNIFLEFMMKI